MSRPQYYSDNDGNNSATISCACVNVTYERPRIIIIIISNGSVVRKREGSPKFGPEARREPDSGNRNRHRLLGGAACAAIVSATQSRVFADNYYTLTRRVTRYCRVYVYTLTAVVAFVMTPRDITMPGQYNGGPETRSEFRMSSDFRRQN